MENELNSKNNLWGNCSVSPRREQLIEIGVFLALIVPSSVISLFVISKETVGFVITAVATILRDFSLVALILFFLWHNGETLKNIGWKSQNYTKEISIGLILFLPFTILISLLENVLQFLGFSLSAEPLPSFLHAKGTAEYFLAILLVGVVAVAEETIFRGYLILRFRAITGSPLTAIILSSVIFSLGHGYEGTAGLISVGFMGALFSVVFLWRQNLTAPVVMHFLQDFIGIVLIPLTGGK
jgi:uncharacterized protein